MKKPTTRRAFRKVRFLIMYTCRKFYNRYGGDLDEMIAQANLDFVKLFQSKFDPARDNLVGFTNFRIWKALLDHRKKERRRKKLAGMMNLEEIEWESIPQPQFRKFDIGEFITTVERVWRSDVEYVIRSIFQPRFLSLPTPTKTIGAMTEFLSKEMKWDRARIRTTYRLIRKALSS